MEGSIPIVQFTLSYPFAVNLRNNYISALGRLSFVDKHHLTRKDARFGHGIPGYSEEKIGIGVLHKELIERQYLKISFGNRYLNNSDI